METGQDSRERIIIINSRYIIRLVTFCEYFITIQLPLYCYSTETACQIHFSLSSPSAAKFHQRIVRS